MKTEQSIEVLREQMVVEADKHGLSSPVVLEISKQIDNLHNLYNKALMQKT